MTRYVDTTDTWKGLIVAFLLAVLLWAVGVGLVVVLS